MGPDAFALGRDERRRLLPGRLDHDPGGLTRLVGLALRHQLDPVVIESRPRRVAVAERVERRRRHRKAAGVPAGARLENEVAAVRNRDVERNGSFGRRHRPGSRGNFLPLRVPRVEPVAFRAANARPLDLRQRHRDRHAWRHLAVRRDRDDLGLEAGLLIDEVRRFADADIPRGRMHGDAGAVRDVLTGDVLDVTFERVGVRDACVRLGLELKRRARRSAPASSLPA